MITNQSDHREIGDLQRLLLSVGLMEFSASTQSGTWGEATQQAVLAAYAKLKWHHDDDAMWISAPALAAIAAALHQHAVDGNDTTGEGVGGSGSQVGGSGSQVGGSGSQVGGSGSQVGGSGSQVGGSGSQVGGSGSQVGGSGSQVGGSGSQVGGSGSQVGGSGSQVGSGGDAE